MNYTKKISAGVGAMLLMLSINTSAQSFCTSTVANASAGTSAGTIVRMADNNCGGNGSLCFEAGDSTSTLTTGEANRAYAAALTALATGTTVQVSWDTNVRACGNVPVVRNFRIVAPTAN